MRTSRSHRPDFDDEDDDRDPRGQSAERGGSPWLRRLSMVGGALLGGAALYNAYSRRGVDQLAPSLAEVVSIPHQLLGSGPTL